MDSDADSTPAGRIRTTGEVEIIGEPTNKAKSIYEKKGGREKERERDTQRERERERSLLTA